MFKKIYVTDVKKRLVGTKCPKCGRVADGATSIDDERPVPMPKLGDVCICLYCGALNQYTETLALRTVTRAEKRRLLRDPRMKQLIETCSWFAECKRREWQ